MKKRGSKKAHEVKVFKFARHFAQKHELNSMTMALVKQQIINCGVNALQSTNVVKAMKTDYRNWQSEAKLLSFHPDFYDRLLDLSVEAIEELSKLGVPDGIRFFVSPMTDDAFYNNPTKDENGVCPFCNTELAFNDDLEIAGDKISVTWVCPECGETGRQTNFIESIEYESFLKHDGTSLETEELAAFDTRFDEGCSVCGEPLEYQGDHEIVDGAICMSWRCHKCNSSGKRQFCVSDIEHIVFE